MENTHPGGPANQAYPASGPQGLREKKDQLWRYTVAIARGIRPDRPGAAGLKQALNRIQQQLKPGDDATTESA